MTDSGFTNHPVLQGGQNEGERKSYIVIEPLPGRD
jgi:hypothetical protein